MNLKQHCTSPQGSTATNHHKAFRCWFSIAFGDVCGMTRPLCEPPRRETRHQAQPGIAGTERTPPEPRQGWTQSCGWSGSIEELKGEVLFFGWPKLLKKCSQKLGVSHSLGPVDDDAEVEGLSQQMVIVFIDCYKYRQWEAHNNQSTRFHKFTYLMCCPLSHVPSALLFYFFVAHHAVYSIHL